MASTSRVNFSSSVGGGNEESASPSSISKPLQIKSSSTTPMESKIVRKSVSFFPIDVSDSSNEDSPSSRRSGSRLRERVSPPSNLNLRDLNSSFAHSAPIGQSPLSASLPRVNFSTSPNSIQTDYVRHCQTPNPKPSSHAKSASNLLYTPQTTRHSHYRQEFGKSPINDFFFDLVSNDLISRERQRNTPSDSDDSESGSEDEEEIILVEENKNFKSPPAFLPKSASFAFKTFDKQTSLASLSRPVQDKSFDSPRKLKTMSLDLRDSNQWFTYRLTMVKHQTDQDLRMYISELDEMTNAKFGGNLDAPADLLTKDDVEKLLRDHIRVLRTIALNIIDCSVQQLQDGEHKQIVKHLQKLNASLLGQERKLKEYPSANMEKRRIVNRECSKLVRKLIFIFSRCSRLLEFLRVQNNSIPAVSEIPNIDLVAPIVSRKRVQSMVASPKTRINLEERLQDFTQKDPKFTDSALTSPITPIKVINREEDDFVVIEKEETPQKKPDDDQELTLPKVDPVSPPLISTPDQNKFRYSLDSPPSKDVSIDSPTSLLPGKTNEKAATFFSKLVSKWKSWTAKTDDISSLSDPESPSISPSASPKRGRSPRRRRKSPRNSGAQYIELLCRICEELVRSDELEAHSKTCAIRHNIDMRSITCDDRLLKLVKSIQKRIQQNETDKSRSSLSDHELNTLHQFCTLAKRAADLKYTNENLLVLQSIIDEIPRLQQQLLQPANTKTGISKSMSIDSLAPSHEQERERRYSLKLNNALTLDIFGKRIEEVIKVKLKTMQERMQLSPNVRVHRVSITDFEILKPISRGAFGRVFLARKKKTGDLYAVKVLRKRDMIRKNQTKRVITERNVMAAADIDFVVRFYYSFSGKEYLYIVMEYCPGGDIFSLLREREQFDCDMIRHYAAEIALALEHLHTKGIVHRDLKPDNILIGQDGHIKLTDFGLSEFGLIDKDPFFDEDDTLSMMDGCASPNNASANQPSPTERLLSPTSNTTPGNKLQVNGTPDYLAPEILLGNEHSFPVDYWALGCMIYEFLYGVPPFHDRSPEAIFDNILSMNIEWPDLGDPEEDDEEIRDIRVCSDLAKQLLVADPSKRLDATGMKSHPFFQKIDWDKILTQTPPFIPQPVTEEDTSYFSARLPMYPVSEDEGAALMHDTTSPPTDNRRSFVHGIHQGSAGSDKGEDIKLGSYEDLMSPNNALSSSMDFSFGNVQHYENLAHKTMEQLQILKNREKSMGNYEDRSSYEGETNGSSYSDDSSSLPCYSPTQVS